MVASSTELVVRSLLLIVVFGAVPCLSVLLSRFRLAHLAAASVGLVHALLLIVPAIRIPAGAVVGSEFANFAVNFSIFFGAVILVLSAATLTRWRWGIYGLCAVGIYTFIVSAIVALVALWNESPVLAGMTPLILVSLVPAPYFAAALSLRRARGGS